ncbi:sugar phosphatase YidA [Peptococcaceae bacterium CEB3]|nr:sugar phosphatase YidA [Peptococcaceae bacterium CEB3]
MAIRLIAMDLDDTLLRNDLTISAGTVATIRRARAQGIITTIATGRTPAAMRPYAEQLEIDVPVITFHGALIQQALSGEVLFRHALGAELARELAADVLSRKMHVQIYCRGKILVQEKNALSSEYERISKVEIEAADLLKLLDDPEASVEKILIIGEEAELDLLTPEFQARYGEKVHLTKSKPFFLEMTDASVNKGAALAALAQRYGIRQEEVMAIGDSFNDLEMLRYAGLGVAVGNARREIREEADAVTLSNEEDGVAAAIEKYALRGSKTWI